MRKRFIPVPVEIQHKEKVMVQGVMAPRFFKAVWPPNFLLALLTFFLVNVTWVFFRSPDFTSAWRLLSSMFGHVTNGVALLSTLSIIKITIITICMVTAHWC
jgi:D-alanyl-lipoteichoic acid acyltransferase DltB (MBOAT superfamily)